MKPKVYVETSVVGYLTSWPSGDLVIVGRQKITRDWWLRAQVDYDLVVSELVIQEAKIGDPQAVTDRLEALDELPVLGISPPAVDLARALMERGAVPRSEPEDALHIALSVVNGVEYLVTWNFKHIANATLRARIHAVCSGQGFAPSTICTPEELLDD